MEEEIKLKKIRFFIRQKSSGLIKEINFSSHEGNLFFAVPFNKEINIICIKIDLKGRKFTSINDFRIYLRQNLPLIGYELLENDDKRIPNELLCSEQETIRVDKEES